MTNVVLKWIVITLTAGIFLFLCFVFYYAWAFSGTFELTYSKQDLIENYYSKSKEIKDLAAFVKTSIPPDKSVQIEFDGDKFGIFHVTANGRTDSNWDIKISSRKSDSLLKVIGFTQQSLEELKAKLDKANCIAIESGEPVTIGFQRSGLGQYFYKVFNKNLTDSLKKQYNDSCQYIFLKENIVLEYGGGAIGAQCFD